MPKLTDDDLRAIRARVEAWRKNQSLWGPVETELTRDIMVNLDIPALLAHADAQDAANVRLREALGKVCDAAMEGYGTTCCTLCYDWTVTAEGEFHHAPGCPVAAARALLEGGA